MIWRLDWPGVPDQLGTGLAAAYLAAGDVMGGLDLGVLGQYGLLGLVAGALFLHARTTISRQAEANEAAVKREIERGDRMEAEVFRLNAYIQDRVVPVLELATTSVTANQQMLADMRRERELDRMRADRRGGGQ
jgi:hypothetical protein